MSLTQLGYLLFSLIFFVLAALMGWKIVTEKERAENSPSWPASNAAVISREVAESYDNRGHLYFAPTIRYTYSAAGQRFAKTIRLERYLVAIPAWFLSNPTPSSSKYYHSVFQTAERHLNSVSDSFEIRYNPEDPEDHVCPWDEFQTGYIW